MPAATRSPEEELIRRDDEEDLKRVTHALLERLSESQRKVAALHTHGRKRREIATQLGLSPRTVKRMLESIMALSRAELVRLAGQGCESGETLIARFAFGLARPREMREAQQHLATCPRCGALYERLDMWRQKVAAVLPLPVVQKAHPGFIERAMHGAAERLSAFAHRGGSRGSGLRERVGEVSGDVKQHATAAYYRTVDPTPLAGLRPGTAAATVAGCLAIGGATYCVQQGVDPTGGLMGVSAPAHYQRHEPRHRKVAHVVQPPTTPADPSNYLRTYKAEVDVTDGQAPSVGIVPDTALGRGDWVSGTQPRDYQATDNVGVRSAQALVSGSGGGLDTQSCLLATPQGVFADGIPCPNGAGQIQVDTKSLREGTQPLIVQAQDIAGNLGISSPVTARIDNTAPARVDVTVDGGEGWRNQNNFSIGWVNPSEGDRAPIAAATYKLCPASGGSCTQGEQDGANIISFNSEVPGAGEWTLSLWRRDAAGRSSTTPWSTASSMPTQHAGASVVCRQRRLAAASSSQTW